MPAQKFNMRKAQRDFKKRANKLANRRQKAEESDDEEVVVHEKQTNMTVVQGVERNTVSRADNIISSAISSGTFIDIDLKTSLLGQLKGQTLKLTVQNNSGGDITPPAQIQECIAFIWIKLNGGNLSVTRMDKETLLYPMRFLDKATLTRYKRGYENNAVIPNSEQRTWYIPLLGDPFALNEVFMQGVKGGVTYNVNFDRNAFDVNPDVVGLEIISRHTYHSEPTMKLLRDNFKSESNVYNYRSFKLQQPTESVVAGSQMEIKLDGFKSKASDVFIQVYNSSQKLVDLGQYIDRYDITDSNNVSLISSGPIDSAYDDIILSAVHDYEPVLGATRDPWTVISFSSDMAEDFLTGSVSGMRQFTGDELLKLTISSDLPAGSYKVKIYFGKIDRFESNGGVISAL